MSERSYGWAINYTQTDPTNTPRWPSESPMVVQRQSLNPYFNNEIPCYSMMTIFRILCSFLGYGLFFSLFWKDLVKCLLGLQHLRKLSQKAFNKYLEKKFRIIQIAHHRNSKTKQLIHLKFTVFHKHQNSLLNTTSVVAIPQNCTRTKL